MDWFEELIQFGNLVVQAIKLMLSYRSTKHQVYVPKHLDTKKGRHF